MQTNLVIVTGTVRGTPKHYPDSGKTAFTLHCGSHRFYVEATKTLSLVTGDAITVIGRLFSRQTQQRDWAGIQATTIASALEDAALVGE